MMMFIVLWLVLVLRQKEVFETLVGEALDKASGKSDPYKDDKTLEYKAQQVQERANKILESRSMTW